jgi:hypothetical protein
MSCDAIRELMHRRLDGETLEPRDDRAYRDHVAGCASCRDAAATLERIQRALQEIETPPFPETALARVWQRTSRPSRAKRSKGRADGPPRAGLVTTLLTSRRWRPVAAAAAVVVVLAGIWAVRPPAGPSRTELERAAAEARMVLAVTGRTLNRSEETAIRMVLEDEVSPALERVIPAARSRSAGSAGN